MMWTAPFLMLALLASAPGELSVSQPARDELAVRSIVGSLASTAQDQTATGRAALFADDAQIINAFGARASGRKQIDAFWKSIFESGTFRNSRIEEKALTVRFLTPTLALADRFYVFAGQRGPSSGRELPPRDIHLTLILRKHADRWLVIYYSVADLRTVGA